MKYALINEFDEIEGIFDRKISHPQKRIIQINSSEQNLIGKKIGTMEPKKMKIAVICNWKTPCGISTYTQFLVDSLRSKVKEIKIFSEAEDKADCSSDSKDNVSRCWKRGESMFETIKQLRQFSPNFVIIQHEFGIFPKATNFLQLLQGLENIPNAVIFHSVYSNHLDKTICTSAVKNIICHSNEAKNVLISTGHTNYIQVINHGCRIFDNINELWNIFQTPYAIVQFGFGFFYKGVDRAIEAVAKLKNDPKYKDIFYCYLCSESPNSSNTHAQYHRHLTELIEKLGLQDNVVILRKYNSESIINNYLRTAKLAIFPYVSDPSNLVYGASGAIRIAMANGIPIVASESHMFDDLQGIIPRPSSSDELAKEIDQIFSDEEYKKNLIDKNIKYIQENNWNITAERYLAAIKNIMEKENYLELQP